MDDIARDVLTQAAKGQMSAFEQVYKASSGFVYNVALRITRNEADAQEVVQDVFMKIYHTLKDFEFRSSFKTWAYRITVNMAINRYRKSARERREHSDGDMLVESLPGNSSAVDSALQSDNEAQVQRLLGMLSEEHKACIVLREIEGLSYQEIAVSLRIPVNTVRTRLLRARQALQEAARKAQVSDAL